MVIFVERGDREALLHARAPARIAGVISLVAHRRTLVAHCCTAAKEATAQADTDHTIWS
jgi:hypothetical protein